MAGARAKKILSEPLVQFALIGLALFAADLAMRPETVDPRLIRVDDEVYGELATVFHRERRRLPSPEEMDELVEVHLENEVLFREARELELDHGDQMMRERLVQRMRLMMFSGIVIPYPGDDTLVPWFEERADDYRRPATVSFRVMGLDGEEAAARAAAARANAEAAAGERVTLSGAPVVNFRARPRGQMVALFDDAFIAAIEAAPKGAWTPVATDQGWQVVLYEGSAPSAMPSFEEVRKTVWGRWREQERLREANAALDAIRARYPVERDLYDPAALDIDEEALIAGEERPRARAEAAAAGVAF